MTGNSHDWRAQRRSSALTRRFPVVELFTLILSHIAWIWFCHRSIPFRLYIIPRDRGSRNRQDRLQVRGSANLRIAYTVDRCALLALNMSEAQFLTRNVTCWMAYELSRHFIYWYVRSAGWGPWRVCSQWNGARAYDEDGLLNSEPLSVFSWRGCSNFVLIQTYPLPQHWPECKPNSSGYNADKLTVVNAIRDY